MIFAMRSTGISLEYSRKGGESLDEEFRYPPKTSIEGPFKLKQRLHLLFFHFARKFASRIASIDSDLFKF